MIRLFGESVQKVFNGREVFNNISFDIHTPSCLGIIGKNGSGKSTLIKIIAGLLQVTKGKILYEIDGKILSPDKLFKRIGFLSPYLQLYDEFTGIENLIIFDEIRNQKKEKEFYLDLLKKVELYDRRNDLLRTYSSGMKQRLKIAFALSNEPDVLLFDEPTSNLDDTGIEIIHSIMKQHKERGILVIASNDKSDYYLFDEIINLNK